MSLARRSRNAPPQNRSNISNQNLRNKQRSRRVHIRETISRAKEISSTAENTEARNGRILKLCHRLVTVRVNLNTRKQQLDDVPIHLAKIMLEKNSVATLTNALPEVDLNYPSVRNLLASVRRPLEH